jgi:membrane associated rhomboid family serine protease
VIPLRDRNPTRRTPVVTFALIGACIAAFAIELSISGRDAGGHHRGDPDR